MIDDYHVTLFLGVMFIISGLMAAANEVIEVHTGFKVQLFHSMIFLGVFNCCMALAFVIIGSRSLEAAEEAAETKGKSNSQDVVDSRLAEMEARLQVLEELKGRNS